MKQNGYVKAVKAAFPYTIPVLTGYLFIGIAFGVMYQEKGYNFLWAILMSILVYAGSGQYLAVNFFAPGVIFLARSIRTLYNESNQDTSSASLGCDSLRYS